MCTLTIGWRQKRRVVTMNRDEQRSRIVEVAPFLWDEPEIFAPQDRKAHGTWIGINQKGVVAALLNGYQPADSQSAHKTRGEIVPKVLSGQSIRPDEYASFHLVFIQGDYIKHSYWDGQNFEERIFPDQDWIFLTSSSWHQDEVKSERQKQFEAWVSRGADFEDCLPTIHYQHQETQTAQSVLMARDDACTKSITQFDIGGDHQICRYWPSPLTSLLKSPPESKEYDEYKGLF